MKYLMSFVAIAISLASVPLFAKNVAGWDVSQRDDSCFMASTFETDTTLAITWYPQIQETRLIVYNRNWDSLRSRNGENVSVKIHMLGKNVEYDEWWHDSAMIVTTDDGLEGVIAFWGKKHEEDLALALMFADSMAIEIDGRNLGGFELKGTYKAIPALRACGSRVLKATRDPFAN